MDAGEALTFQDLAIESASREPDHRAAEAFGGSTERALPGRSFSV